MNCEKFTRNQSGNILVHCNRSDPNRTYKNQEIHHDRTHWNYNLAPKHEGMTDYEFMKSKCEEFKILKNNLDGRSIDDYKKVVQAKIKDLNKQKETIPVRIDELTNTLITEHEIDYEKIEKEKAEYNQQLQAIELEMTDVQAKAKENMRIADQLAAAKKELSDFKLKKETEYSQKYSADLINLQNEKRVIESKIRYRQDEDSDRLLKIQQDQKRKAELYQMKKRKILLIMKSGMLFLQNFLKIATRFIKFQ